MPEPEYADREPYQAGFRAGHAAGIVAGRIERWHEVEAIRRQLHAVEIERDQAEQRALRAENELRRITAPRRLRGRLAAAWRRTGATK